MVIENGIEGSIRIVHRASVAEPNMVTLGLQVVHFGVKFHIESFDVGRQRVRQIHDLLA
jgi:hypothetical protein